MKGSLSFDVVPDELAESLRDSNPERRAWVKPLEDGKMLRMSKRPQWVRSDRQRTGMKLVTRQAGDQTDDVFVWLVRDESIAASDSVEGQLADSLRIA